MQGEYLFEMKGACSYASAHRKEQQREYERAEREDKQHETV